MCGKRKRAGGRLALLALAACADSKRHDVAQLASQEQAASHLATDDRCHVFECDTVRDMDGCPEAYIGFSAQSVALNEAALRTLKEGASDLARLAPMRLTIRGHRRPAESDGVALARAEVVRDQLLRFGADRKIVRAEADPSVAGDAGVTFAVECTSPSAAIAPAIPEHLRHWPGLYVRSNDRIIDAPATDQSVAKRYPRWRNKGSARRGMRLTIMTMKTSYAINEEVRVVHVLEAEAPGLDVYVMGPKTVFGEYVDDALRTPKPRVDEYPWLDGAYDGRVLKSPAVDYNYEIASYRFADPGLHRIEWKVGDLASNTVVLRVKRALGQPIDPGRPR